MKKIIVISIIVLFVGTCITPSINGKFSGLNNNEEISRIPYVVSDSAILTFHTFNKKSEKQTEVVIPPEVSNNIVNIIVELKHMITNEPGNDKTKALKIEFVDLLDRYDLIPKDLSMDYVLSLLNSSWENNKQRTIGVKPAYPILKGFLTRILGVFANIQQFFKMRFRNTIPIGFNENIQQSDSLDMTAKAGFSFIQGAGSGGTFPEFLWPLPRFIFRLNFADGGFGVDPNTGRSFDAWAPLNAVFLGFWGIGWTVEVPFEPLVFVFFGCALFVSVSADKIQYAHHSPQISEVRPPNNAIDVPLSLSELSFRLTDIDGDPMNYTVNTNPYIGNGSGSNVGNGVYSVPVSGLERNTQYRWFLKVDDGICFLQNQYTFKTES